MFIPAVIIFILALLTIVGLFLLKIASFSQRQTVRISIPGSVTNFGWWLYLKKKAGQAAKQLWHFILEAKDLKPAVTKTFQAPVERVKSAFKIRIRSSESDPVWLPEATDPASQPALSQNPEDLYLEAIRKNPNDPHAYEALGRLYLQNKNYADAIQTYEYLIKLNPQVDIYWSNLGLAYYSTQEYQKAVAAYEKALSINKKIPTRWINLSLCYEALEDKIKTVRALAQAVELDKFNVNYLMMLADSYLRIPNLVRAEEVLEQILGIEPTNRPAREKLMRLKI